MKIDMTIGKNLVRLRGSLSQDALAARMKARGWKWSQSTVWSIETGARQLRLAEVVDVIAVLRESTGVDWPLTALIESTPDERITAVRRELALVVEQLEDVRVHHDRLHHELALLTEGEQGVGR